MSDSPGRSSIRRVDPVAKRGETDGGPRLRVACVGDGPAVASLERDPATVVEWAEAPEALSDPGGADCVVVTPAVETPVAAVDSLRGRAEGVPVVVCVADPETVQAATAAGATEFFRPPAGAESEDRWSLLSDRVETVVERERATASLRETRDTLRELHAVDTAEATDMEEVIARALAVGVRRLGVADAFLSRVDTEDRRLETVATHDGGDLVEDGETFDLDTTYCRRTVDRESPLAVSDAAEQGWTDDPAHEDHGLSCYLGGQVTVGGELYGTLCFVDETARTPFDGQEVAILETLADWVGREVERHRSRRRLDEVLDRMEDAFFAVDTDWEVTYANDGGKQVLARAMELDPETDAVVGRHLWESVPEAVDTAFYEHYTEAMETQETVTFDAEYEPLDVHFEARAHPSETGLSVYFSDVSDRVRREQRLTDLHEVTRELMGVADPERMAELVSEAAGEVLDFAGTGFRLYDPATDRLQSVAIGSTVEGVDADDRPGYPVDDSPHGRAFRSGEPVQETVGDGPDPYGREPFEAVLYVPVGDHGVLSVGTTDGELSTTDRRLTELLAATCEAALDRAERDRELLVKTRAMEEADIALSLIDPNAEDEPVVWVNDGFTELTGYDRETVVGRNCRFLQGADTDPERTAELRRAIEAEESTEVVLRNYRADGTPFWNRVAITPIFDESGAMLRYLGSQTDVTEAVERERRTEALLEFQRSLGAAGSTDDLFAALRGADVEALGFDVVGVRRYDPETDRLEPIALNGEYGTHEGRPSVGPDSPHYHAFESGAARVERVPTDDEYDRDPFEAVLYVPVGDHGVLSVGVEDEFDAVDRQIAELLATGIEAAFDRLDRLETLELYEDVLTAVQGMVYVADDEGRFRLVTEPLAEALGTDPETLVGQEIAAVVGPERERERRQHTERLTATDVDSVAWETRMPTPEGEQPVEVEVAPLPGATGTVGVVRDRSELAATRDERDLQRDRARKLVENLPDPVVETELTPDGARILGVNDAFREVFSPDRDPVGADVDEVVRPAEADDAVVQPADLAVSLWDGRVVTETVRRRTADGFRDFLFQGIPFETGGTLRAFGVYTDITDQKHRERRLEVLNRVLRHNFRNRMTVVSGYADVLAEELLTETTDDTVRTAVRELKRGVDDIVGLNQQARDIQRAFADDETTRLDLVPVVETVAERYRDRGATVEVDLPDRLPATTGEAVRVAVEQIVDNAVEHGATGERGAADVWVRVDGEVRPDGMVALRIHDDGPGIPEHERAVITGERAITQLEHGSGLGLWTVKWVAEADGGSVDIDADDGGTTVTLVLPGSDAETAGRDSVATGDD